MKWLYRVTRILLMFLVYIGVGYFGNLVSIHSGSFVILLPAFTLAILMVYYLGYQSLPVIFAGTFIMSFYGYHVFELHGFVRVLPALIIAVGTTFSAFAGGRCLQVRIRDHGGKLFSAPRFFSFLFFVVVLPSLFNAFFITLAEFIFFSPPEIFLRFIIWLLAGFIGIILVVPFVLTWADPEKPVLKRYGFLELAILLLILIPFIYLITSNQFNNPVKNFMIGYFLLPVYLWLAIRFDSKITTLIVLMSILQLIVVSMLKSNYYIMGILEHPNMMMQGFMFVIMVVTYLTHSFFRERIMLIKSLSQSEANTKAVIENMPVALAIMNKNGRNGYVNHNFVRLTGYEGEDLPSMDTWFEKAFPDYRSRKNAREIWESVLQRLPGDGPVEEELQIITKEGRKKDILFVMSFLEEKMLVALSDMTQRKQMTEKIIENERRVNTLIQNLQGMVFQCRMNQLRTMNFVSEGTFALTGFLPSDFTSGRMEFSSLILPGFRKRIMEEIQAAIRKGEPYEVQYQLKARDKEVKWVSERGKGFYNDKGVCLGVEGLIVDITDRINMLESLRFSEQRYKSLFDNIPLSLWEDDYSEVRTFLNDLKKHHDGDLGEYLLADSKRVGELVKRIRIIDLNRSSVSLYGETSKERLAKSVNQVFVEEDYASLVEVMMRLMNGETYIENNATEITIGNQVKTLSISWYVMPGHENDLARVLVTIVDVTDLTRAKKAILDLNQQLEEKVVKRTFELDRANKELEAFSYSVSHDLKAPLRAIKGFSSLLKSEAGERLDEKSMRYLNHVTENVDNMARLINDLLQFSRLGRKSLSFKEVDTTALVSSVWDELTGLEKDFSCEFTFDDLPFIYADESLLRQVFINLLSNALKFSSATKSCRIMVRGTRSGHNWLFSVEDNGIGFEQKYEEKIFKVFQRLHNQEEFEGSGVGLALVQRIVHRHGGRVWGEGNPGKGSIFYFTIPVEIDSE